MFIRYPKTVIGTFVILTILSAYVAVTQLRFSFDIADFFPSGDKDLEFFQEFKDRFEPDDNFMFVALHRPEGAFDSTFLHKAQNFSLDVRDLSFPISKISDKDTFDNKIYFYQKDTISGDSTLMMRPVVTSQSLFQFKYPLYSPLMGFTAIPAIHLDEPARYEKDKQKILKDDRLVGTLISKDGNTLVVSLKTHTNITAEFAYKFVHTLNDLIEKEYKFEHFHLLGPANFQVRLVEVNLWEFLFSMVVSFFLILTVMYLIFRRFWGVFIALMSITVGLVMFIGILGLLGRELDTMAMLYPIIMLIVGTSDVIHVMSKYVDELRKGQNKDAAIQVTIKEIGMSIFLTSATTAVGFLSLVTSKVIPIRDFGINAAMGVMIAYVSIIIFTTTVLSLFREEQIIKLSRKNLFWEDMMERFYHFTARKAKPIVAGFVVLFVLCGIGISKVTTNHDLHAMLPKKHKVTDDFRFFEDQLSGFRPLDIAVMVKDGYKADDYEVLQQIDKIEQHLKQQPEFASITSVTTLYKSIRMAFKNNKWEAYQMPKTEKEYKKYKKQLRNLGGMQNAILVSKDGQAARISARMLDVGADSIRNVVDRLDIWIAENTDASVATFKQTGTGVIMDKNSVYIRDSLLKGLGFAIFVISIFIALLYRNIKMLFIALIPNLLPLLIAGAILGYLNIPLEAGVAIVFAIIFGIAVDDTIHLLSRFKLLTDRGVPNNEAIRLTLRETGKAICLTSVILFFGFLILLFSNIPPAVTVGLLIGLTLVSALVCDLLIIPIMLRFFLKDKPERT